MSEMPWTSCRTYDIEFPPYVLDTNRVHILIEHFGSQRHIIVAINYLATPTIGRYTEKGELQSLGAKLVGENLNRIRNDETLPKAKS